MIKSAKPFNAPPLLAGMFVCLSASGLLSAGPAPGHTSHAGDHDFAYPREKGVELTSKVEHVRLAWKNPTHTGFIKGNSSTALELLQAGIEPAYGESASPLLSDGVLLVSWSQPSGEVTARLDSFNQRYYRNVARNKALQSTYFRIDADWHTLAVDAETGETLWHNVERSASMNFLSSKRGHDGITGAVRDGVYVTVTILGHVYAYDLHSGETRWSTTLESWNRRAQAFKDEALADRNMPQVGEGPFGRKRSGAILVDGVAVIPDLNGGLIGLNAEDGTQMWHTADAMDDTASPRPWIHEGKTWLVCNRSNRGERLIHLMDPLTGTMQWSHPTGTNPGQLLMGEGYILLNPQRSIRGRALLTAYRLGTDGLSELWSFSDTEAHGVQLRPDFGAHRKGVIHQDILYLRAGRGTVSIDMNSGEERHRVEQSGSLPFIAEDKLYMQANASHSGRKAGLRLFQLEEGGRFSYLGEAPFQGFDFQQVTEYEHPLETPYAGGKIYMRGHYAIAALDLTVVDTPMAELALDQLWAGFPQPVRALMFTGDEGRQPVAGRLQPPAREKLGIPATSAYRKETWTSIVFSEPVVLGEAFTTPVEIGFVQFSWTGTLAMETAEGNQWNGTWSRHFPGWEETIAYEGGFPAGVKPAGDVPAARHPACGGRLAATGPQRRP
ncbi:MAG: PQQ-binding-like beta-propeller repeat protein [Ectothiorhodospiraceae bacterium]